jgi:hypothetical protein
MSLFSEPDLAWLRQKFERMTKPEVNSETHLWMQKVVRGFTRETLAQLFAANIRWLSNMANDEIRVREGMAPVPVPGWYGSSL